MSETWIAMIPISLSGAEKHCLEVIDRFGEYIDSAGYSTIDPEVLQELEERDFIAVGRRMTPGSLVYSLTDIGRFWLRNSLRGALILKLDRDSVSSMGSADRRDIGD